MVVVRSLVGIDMLGIAGWSNFYLAGVIATRTGFVQHTLDQEAH